MRNQEKTYQLRHFAGLIKTQGISKRLNTIADELRRVEMKTATFCALLVLMVCVLQGKVFH